MKYLLLLFSILAIGFYVLKPNEPHSIILASTTSTEDSGLLKYLTPIFKAKTGIDVKVIAVGTGQAFAIAAKGDADALLVHDRKGEDEFALKFNVERRDVMVNDFVFVGATGKYDSVTALLQAVIAEKLPFVSRGDDSGTHRKEMALWKMAGLNPRDNPNYKEVGSGMGAALNTATALNAIILSDRATWAAFKNKQLAIILEGDKALLNPYGSLLVKPKAKPWHEWLTSPEGKKAITDFRVNGQQLFF